MTNVGASRTLSRHRHIPTELQAGCCPGYISSSRRSCSAFPAPCTIEANRVRTVKQLGKATTLAECKAATALNPACGSLLMHNAGRNSSRGECACVRAGQDCRVEAHVGAEDERTHSIYVNGAPPPLYCPSTMTNRCTRQPCQCEAIGNKVTVLSNHTMRPCFSCKARKESCDDSMPSAVYSSSNGRAMNCTHAAQLGLCSLAKSICCRTCSATSSSLTRNGCVCHPYWRPKDQYTSPRSKRVCKIWNQTLAGGVQFLVNKGLHAGFNGCGMRVPCDGDDGGTPGGSWCEIDRNQPCQNETAQGESLVDYCTPSRRNVVTWPAVGVQEVILSY